MVVVPFGDAAPIQRERLTRGRGQVIVVGAQPEELESVAHGRLRVASLRLEPVVSPPLRLVASILLAEVSRQVGRRRPMPGEPAPRPPSYDATLRLLLPQHEVVSVESADLLAY
jgi:hypothetical protein